MNKSKILGAVITASTEMTDLCSEISHNVISETETPSGEKSKKSKKHPIRKNEE